MPHLSFSNFSDGNISIVVHTFERTVNHKLSKNKYWNYEIRAKSLLIRLTWQDYVYTIIDNGTIKSIMILTDGNTAVTFHNTNTSMSSRQLTKNEDAFDDFMSD